jgi:hypothetical protein
MDLWYDDLWSCKRGRISCSKANRVQRPTEVFLSLEKPKEVLAKECQKNAEDGGEEKLTCDGPAPEKSDDASVRTSHILIFLSTPQLKIL